jgi:hypothetical protein
MRPVEASRPAPLNPATFAIAPAHFCFCAMRRACRQWQRNCTHQWLAPSGHGRSSGSAGAGSTLAPSAKNVRVWSRAARSWIELPVEHLRKATSSDLFSGWVDRRGFASLLSLQRFSGERRKPDLASKSGVFLAAKLHIIKCLVLLAESGGFEPPVELLVLQRFSKPPPSATRPTLQPYSLRQEIAHTAICPATLMRVPG